MAEALPHTWGSAGAPGRTAVLPIDDVAAERSAGIAHRP